MEQVDLTDCDKEPIHIPSAIQPFGALLAIEGDTIIAASENCGLILGIDTNDLLGEKYTKVLGTNGDKLIEAALRKAEPTSPTMVQLTVEKKWITTIAFRQGKHTIVECERLEDEDEQEIASLKFVREKSETVLSYLAFIAEGIRKVTGYQRVMIYRFADDWHGEVIAESKSSDLHSFYGHHFPATDIPEPARRLFTTNWVRMIADVDYIPVPLHEPAQPLDLTLSALRSVSPIHLQYLRNMEVAASLTLSIICNDRLWGLIACHHLEPKYLPAHLRAVCALIAKMVSSRVTAIEVADFNTARDMLLNFVLALKKRLASGEDLNDFIRTDKHDLWKLMNSDGFDFIAKEYSTSAGHGMNPEQLKELLKLLASTGKSVLHYTNLKNAFPQWSDAFSGGVMAISVNQNWFIWNKKELVRSITWAGHPEKITNSPDKLSPRTSFADWQEQVKDTCSAWQPYEIELAFELEKIVTSACGGKEHTFKTDKNAYLNRLNSAIDEDVKSLQGQIDFA